MNSEYTLPQLRLSVGDKVGQHIVSSALLLPNRPTWLDCRGKKLTGRNLLGRQSLNFVVLLSFVFKFNITTFSKYILEDSLIDETLNEEAALYGGEVMGFRIGQAYM